MITTQDEAIKHANHAHLGRFRFVIVLPDGGIYATNNKEQIEPMVNESVFIVKGDLSIPKKKLKVKESE